MRRLGAALALLVSLRCASVAPPAVNEIRVDIHGAAIGRGATDHYFLDVSFEQVTPTGRIYSSQRIEVTQHEFTVYRTRASACWSGGHIRECKWN